MSDEEIRRLDRSNELSWVERFKLIVRHGARPPEKPADFMAPVFDKSQRSDQDDVAFKDDDVEVVIAEVDLTPDEAWSDTEVAGIYALKDGRFGYAMGTADSSGWG